MTTNILTTTSISIINICSGSASASAINNPAATTAAGEGARGRDSFEPRGIFSLFFSYFFLTY
jgi:hypothetical protein